MLQPCHHQRMDWQRADEVRSIEAYHLFCLFCCCHCCLECILGWLVVPQMDLNRDCGMGCSGSGIIPIIPLCYLNNLVNLETLVDDIPSNMLHTFWDIQDSEGYAFMKGISINVCNCGQKGLDRFSRKHPQNHPVQGIRLAFAKMPAKCIFNSCVLLDTMSLTVLICTFDASRRTRTLVRLAVCADVSKTVKKDTEKDTT